MFVEWEPGEIQLAGGGIGCKDVNKLMLLVLCNILQKKKHRRQDYKPMDLFNNSNGNITNYTKV